jgi:hypothetical protein
MLRRKDFVKSCVGVPVAEAQGRPKEDMRVDSGLAEEDILRAFLAADGLTKMTAILF